MTSRSARAPRSIVATVLTVLAVLAVLTAAGCSGTPGPAASSPGTAGTTSPTSQQVYLSVGDSYAAGYQPTGERVGGTTTNGFAYRLVDDARARGYDLRLVNVGCSGARTTTVLHRVGCRHGNLGPGAAPYDTATQADAAVAVLQRERGHVGLITVALGGNDITSCAVAADPVPCLVTAVAQVRTNLTTLVGRLRAAAGPGVPIIGITYPDVVLGGYVTGGAAGRRLADLSVTAFRQLVNPALAAAYASAGGRLVDITALTGAYGALSVTTSLAPYGTVPVPVARVCELTFACRYRDIHPTTAGYALISRAVADALPVHRG